MVLAIHIVTMDIITSGKITDPYYLRLLEKYEQERLKSEQERLSKEAKNVELLRKRQEAHREKAKRKREADRLKAFNRQERSALRQHLHQPAQQSDEDRLVSVYAIFAEKSKSVYVGQSIDTVGRKAQHFSDLARGEHHNYMLQSLYNEDSDQLSFVVIEEGIPYSDRLVRESYYNTFYHRKGYKICSPSNACISVPAHLVPHIKPFADSMVLLDSYIGPL